MISLKLYSCWFLVLIYIRFQIHWTAFDKAVFHLKTFFKCLIEIVLPNLFNLVILHIFISWPWKDTRSCHEYLLVVINCHFPFWGFWFLYFWSTAIHQWYLYGNQGNVPGDKLAVPMYVRPRGIVIINLEAQMSQKRR